MTPYEAALDARFHHLSPQVRQLHGARNLSWKGQVTVERGAHPGAGLIAKLLGFPGPMDKAPFHLTLERNADGSETWARDFAGHKTVSTIRCMENGALEESFGTTRMILATQVKADQLHMKVVAVSLLGRITLPRKLVPKSRAHVWQDEAGRYRFDISSQLPFGGQLIRYFGWLRPDASTGFATDR